MNTTIQRTPERLFFDTEFTHLGKDAELISIGLILGNLKLYAEITDFDESKCSDFTKDHVLPHRCMQDKYDTFKFWYDMTDDGTLYLCGSKKMVGEYVRRILLKNSEYHTVYITPVSDVCHYDMVLILDLIEHTENDLEWFCPACIDICQELMTHDVDMEYAFNVSRETLCTEIPAGTKHNSLYDALVIKNIYESVLHM